jgi:hypothetical protein
MWRADEFLKLFDAEGRFRDKDGAVDVVFLTNTGRYPGRLEFKNGLCVSADMEGSSPWVYPDRSPLSGLRLHLDFDREATLVILINDGRVLTPESFQAEARQSEAIARAESSGITINQRARTALLSLSAQEQLAVIEAVLGLAKQPPAKWPVEIAPRLAEDKPVYLLKVSEDLRAFIRVPEGSGAVELFDIVREATLQAFLKRSQVASGAK